jgi:hypothetical protein
MLKLKLSEFLDKLVLLFAMVAFLAIGLSAIKSSKSLDTLSRHQREMPSESKVDVDIVEADISRVQKATWMNPRSQQRGSKWLFDVFTPPRIYYNPVSQEFVVTPPDLLVKQDTSDPWSSFGIALLDVRPRPYRLQLIGYAGESGNYIATFEYIPTGEALLAKEGNLLVEVGVKIMSFDVKQMEVEHEGSMRVYENVGVAKLMDFEQNEEIFLTNLETKIFSDLEARVRILEDGQEYVVREGSQVKLEHGLYIIGDLSSEPKEAMVTRVSQDGSRRQSKLLTPSGQPRILQKELERNVKPVSPFAIRSKADLRKG